ncbi:MAG: hypothetical protein NT077_00355 [Candidatus Taylorbacteria bacterium]|nr:hypothetical protein [Candidatus Taylorbacteria bacterium]
MNALIEILSSLVSVAILVGILWWIVSAANRNLNSALPKVGRGKKAKGGGDAATDWTRKQIFWAGRQTGRLVWDIAKRPFR